MALARSFTESGSDEVRDGIVDICSYCATDEKLQPATHFCFDCGVYGRYICGICLRNHNKFVNNHDVERIGSQSDPRRKQLQTDLAAERRKSESLAKKLTEALQELDIHKEKSKEVETERKLLSEALKKEEERLKNAYELASSNEKCANKLYQELNKAEHLSKENLYMQKDIEKLRKEKNSLQEEKNDQMVEVGKLKSRLQQAKDEAKRQTDFLKETFESERRIWNHKLMELEKEKNDLRDRFSKLAGAKLCDQNAGIADLSDPNRSMKLSERFGQLYDDEWLNAFQTLTEKKMGLSLKDAVAFLLRLLQDCWPFCNSLLTTQMESLQNAFLHPFQNMVKTDPRKNVGGLKDRPKIGSKEDKTLRELRRKIGVAPAVIEEVNQSFLSEVKSWAKGKSGYDTKHIDSCAPYIQKCAEICWLMAVHDPPLYMKMDVKPGEKLDPNVYTVYSSSGNTIDFLVWPPLLNGKDGGLLAKGVAEPMRTVGKKK